MRPKALLASKALLGLFSISICLAFVNVAQADDHADYKLNWTVQDRVMFSQSDIGTADSYDFFQQRVRLGLDFQLPSGVGAYTQVEYRGVFGGVNGYEPANTPFNRLTARGVRYGYLYFPGLGGHFQVGLVPLNDELHQTLFSADWDFDVGGIAYTADTGDYKFRAAFLRLIDGSILTQTFAIQDQNQNMFVLDADGKSGIASYGLHYYGMYGNVCFNPADCEASPPTATFSLLNQTWLAATFALNNDVLPFDAFVAYNFGNQAGVTNQGYLALLEAKKSLPMFNVSFLALGTNAGGGTGYETIEDIEGTAGYWGYGHIFTANGPSDANGYILNPANKGLGLQSVQLKLDRSFCDTLNGNIFGAYFRSASAVNQGNDLGVEVGIALSYKIDKYMIWDAGFSSAFLGDAGQALYQGNNTSYVHEVFSRLQLEI